MWRLNNFFVYSTSHYRFITGLIKKIFLSKEMFAMWPGTALFFPYFLILIFVDSFAIMLVGVFVVDNDDKGRILRRTMIRYVTLAYCIALRYQICYSSILYCTLVPDMLLWHTVLHSGTRYVTLAYYIAIRYQICYSSILYCTHVSDILL